MTDSYIPELICHKTAYQYETEKYTEPFDPTLVDNYPAYQADTYLGDRPATPIDQLQTNHLIITSRNQTER